MRNGPSSRKARAANLTSGRGWGLNIPEGRVSLPLVCESLRTRKGRNSGAARRPVSANPSLTVGRYGSINRGETSPREVMRKKPSLSPSGGIFVSAFCQFPCVLLQCTHTESPQITTTLNCHQYVKGASRGDNGVATALADRERAVCRVAHLGHERR